LRHQEEVLGNDVTGDFMARKDSDGGRSKTHKDTSEAADRQRCGLTHQALIQCATQSKAKTQKYYMGKIMTNSGKSAKAHSDQERVVVVIEGGKEQSLETSANTTDVDEKGRGKVKND